MTKKEQAKAELMALPMVALKKVTVPGTRWRDYALCCRVNGVVYLQPKDTFKTNWVSEHLKKENFGPLEAIPIRSMRGPLSWIVSVKALDRMYDQILGEVHYSDERSLLRDKIDTLMLYEGELPELTLSHEEIEAAKQHVANRNRLQQEAKEEQNQQIASVVGGGDGNPLSNYELSQGTLSKLSRAGITTVEQLMSWNRLDLLKIGGFGRKALTEVDYAIERYGWERCTSKKEDDRLTVTLAYKPGDMITWREWTKEGGFGKEHQTKVEDVTVRVYWDETRQQYTTTEKYSTTMMSGGQRVDVTVDQMGNGLLIGCM